MTDKNTVKALDSDHWEGTPEHVRYVLGCQLERLAEASDTAETDDLAELTFHMTRIAKILGETWLRPAQSLDEYKALDDDDDDDDDDDEKAARRGIVIV